LQVQGLPYRPRLDILGFESQTHYFPISPENRRVDLNAGEPSVAPAEFCFGHEGEPRQVSKQTPIGRCHVAPRVYPLRENSELAPTDTGKHVAKPVIEADVRMLVVRGGITRLSR
jgi:hypothetical protein